MHFSYKLLQVVKICEISSRLISYFQWRIKREVEKDIEAGEKNNYSAVKENGLSSQDFDERQQTEWTIKQEQGNYYEDNTSNEVPSILL